MKRIFLIVFFIMLLISCNEKPADQTQPTVSSAITIEKVKLVNLDGLQVDLKKYAGKALFINFWATWCKPCIEEMPSIQNAIAALKEKNIEFLFASDESKEEISAFISQNKYAFNFLISTNQEELNVLGLPTTFIFNPNGKLMYSDVGARKWDSPESLDLLKKIAEQ
jgi:thiol-disulfide isomerase/thioredoxin